MEVNKFIETPNRKITQTLKIISIPDFSNISRGPVSNLKNTILGQTYVDAAKNFEGATIGPGGTGFWGSNTWFIHDDQPGDYTYFIHPAIRLVHLITLEEVEIWPYNNSSFLSYILCDRFSTTNSYSNTGDSPNEPTTSWFADAGATLSYGMWVAAYIPSQVTGGRSQLHNYLDSTNHPGGSDYFGDVVMYDYNSDDTIGNSKKLKPEYYMNPITRASHGLSPLNQPAYYMYLIRSSGILYWPSDAYLTQVDWDALVIPEPPS